ncbi:MAG: endolytic transglycosylase MltG [Treponema sp.]|nr:endolytic transglycosylase MltG [Treponema sp.]
MKKKKGFIIFLTVLAVFLVLVIGVFTGGYLYCSSKISPLVKIKSLEPADKQIEEISDIRFQIDYGTSVYTIAQNLEKEKVIKSAQFFYYFIRYPQVFTKLFKNAVSDTQEEIDFLNNGIELKSGVAFLSPTMKYAEIVKNLSSGQQEFVKVSIPEGLTISKIGAILEENQVCTKDDFKKSCSSVENLVKYNIPGQNLEGFLFPDTYYFNYKMDSDSVVDLMVENFKEKTASIEELKGKSFFEMYDILKLASIVEREYRVPEEAPLIASVFANRLKYNIGLYSCATVEYIITEIQGKPHPGRILIQDTKIDNPYNTYVWAGLPPGPISNPGLVALKAAAKPAKTKYFYFQIVDAEAGRHVFSQTFDEHKVNHNLDLKK